MEQHFGGQQVPCYTQTITNNQPLSVLEVICKNYTHKSPEVGIFRTQSSTHKENRAENPWTKLERQKSDLTKN